LRLISGAASERLKTVGAGSPEGRRTTPMKKEKPANQISRGFIPGEQYRGMRGKVVDWVEHKFEEGLLYLHVRFTDKTELCWRIATHMTIEEGDLSDWTSGDFAQLRVFVKNERDRSM
jgi:hypothetical protein